MISRQRFISTAFTTVLILCSLVIGSVSAQIVPEPVMKDVLSQKPACSDNGLIPVKGELLPSTPTPSILMDDVSPVSRDEIWSDDFEDGFAHWDTLNGQGLWDIGTPTSGPNSAHSGYKCAATNLYGDYFNYAFDGLYSEAITLPTPSGMTEHLFLGFYHWYQIESGYDVGSILISEDNGQTWTMLREYDGTSSGWEYESGIDITSYAGRTIFLCFMFDSDYSIVYPGWYVDDVIIWQEVTTSWTTETGGDLDTYVSMDDCLCDPYPDGSPPLDFEILFDTDPSSFPRYTLIMTAWDVDQNNSSSCSNLPEVDNVYFNNHFLGKLTGADDSWSICTFEILPEWIYGGSFSSPGVNQVDIWVNDLERMQSPGCCSWCVKIDYGTLTTDTEANHGLSFGNITDYGEDTDYNGLYDKLVTTIQVFVDAGNSGTYNINGVLKTQSGVEIIWDYEQTFLNVGSNTLELEFDGETINSYTIDGPYELTNLSAYRIDDVNTYAWKIAAHVTDYYSYTDFETSPYQVPRVIEKYPTEGSTADPSVTVSAVFNIDMNPATINTGTFIVMDATGYPLSGQVSYDSSERRAEFTPFSQFVEDQTYQVMLTQDIESVGGVSLPYTETWGFSISGAWPEDVGDPPYLVFKIIQPGGSMVTKVRLSGDHNWIPWAAKESSSEVPSEQDSRDLPHDEALQGSYAIFNSSKLEDALEVNYGVDYEIWRIELLDADDDLVAHMKFHYTMGFYNDDIGIDAIIYVHNDLDPMPQSNPYPGWEYYEPGEYQATMLIPPMRDIYNIDPDRQPTLYVHGVGGSYPYWGDPNDSRPAPTPDRIYPEYNTWQFYYPYDQPIVDSAFLLGRALSELLQNGGINNAGTYDSDKVNIVAHSMGGLVTRSLIQSDNYAYNINKLMMFATPNHGSYNSRMVYYGLELVSETIEVLLGKNHEAPAYADLTMGSDYYYDLFSSPPRFLGSGEVPADYLVIAGTRNILGSFHEISNQQDGVVSVSSASLLEYGIPLGLLDAAHDRVPPSWRPVLDTHEYAEELAQSFLDDTYEPEDGLQQVTCWRTGFDAPSCNDIESAGLLTMRLNSSHSPILHMRQLGNTIELSRFYITEKHFMKRIPETNQYYSRNTHYFDDCGVRFDESPVDDPYDLKFGRWVGENRGIVHILDAFDFHHQSTTMLDINLDYAFAIALNSNNCAPLFPGSGRDFLDFAFTSDAGIDTLVFILSNGAGDPSFIDHSMVLVDPNGIVIDPHMAASNPSIDFHENVDYGLVSYMVALPEVGDWQVQVNDDLEDPKVTAYFTAELEVALSATEVSYPDSIEVVAEVLGGEACISDYATVEYAFDDAGGGSLDYRGEITLEEDPTEPGTLRGWLLPDKVGSYYFSMSYACDQGFGEPILRQAFVSTSVSLASGPDTEGPVSDESIYFFPNPINPMIDTGQFRFRLSREASVTITVYDASSRSVSILECGYQPADTEIAWPWDCKNSSGAYVANGVYFFVIESSAGERGVGKLAVLK